MADITDLLSYYQNLLIFQYNQQPNALATINLITEAMLANGVALDIQNAYNITGDDIAQGVQLDVIGKYVGVDRYYSLLSLENYLALVTYAEVALSELPTSPPAFGLSTYTAFSEFSWNGTLQYSDIIATQNILSDAAFLILIQFAIIINNCNFSDGAIDAALYQFFGDSFRAEDMGFMHMAFFASGAVAPVVQALIAKNLLPVPMGVGASVVNNITGDMFSFTDYSGAVSPYGGGFSTYSDYATLAGQTLSYNQITPV
jgi:hypothetical protein